MSSISVQDFFKPLELNSAPLPEEYYQIEIFEKFSRAFTQLTHQSVYVIDYYKRGFVYVSENPLFLCGHTAKEVKEDGYLFYLKNVPREDLELLLEINVAGFEFYKHIPVNDRLEYFISYDFHLIQQNKNYLLINHKLTPLLLDKDANIWLALCVVSLASNDKAGNITIGKRGKNSFHQYNREKKTWEEQRGVILNDREKDILILSGQGLTMEKIAENLFLSIDTIKFHKKHLFKKLKARNISEAILSATNYHII